MRQRALHSAAETTVRHAAGSRGHPDVPPSTSESDGRTTPSALGLPASPTPDRGLVPSGWAEATIDDAPLSAVRCQRFAAVPLCHDVRPAETNTGVRLTATLTNHGDEPWGYRVPRGPAPFAGGRSVTDEGLLRVRRAGDEDGLFSDGALRPGESVHTTLSVTATGDARLPAGEHTFYQPLTVWTDERAYGYNWQVTLEA
jgi:hypothetical protein